jgi:large subunit ribosomal protein L39e
MKEGKGTFMTSRKPTGKKQRLYRAMKSNRRVPAWVMMRTAKQFTRHPKRYHWRQTKLKK